MAALLFCEVLVGDFGLEILFEVHLAQTTVLVFKFLHVGHHGGVHAAELGAPLVERGGADALLAADHWHLQTGLGLPQKTKDLFFAEFTCSHVHHSLG